MSAPGTEEYGLRSSALCVNGPRNRRRGPAPHTGLRRRDVHGCCLLDSGYAPTPCRGVRLTGQTPEPTNAHAQSDTGPDIADHAPASSTSHAGPTVSSARQGGRCWVGGRDRCDSEHQPGRRLTLMFLVPGSCVGSSPSGLDRVPDRVPIVQGKMKARQTAEKDERGLA